MFAIIRAFRMGMFNADLLKQIAGKDLRSGIVVGIIALPMSIGIALASGFPPFAGIVTSILGGLLVSFISGSRLCIKGPAGGLSALTFSCVLVMGNGNILLGYSLTLAVIMVSGLFQALSSFAKMGNLGDFFPAAAIHGMLASLGFIMVVKQLPPLLGSQLAHVDSLSILSHIPEIFSSLNPKIAILGVGSLTILYLHNFLPKGISNLVPSIILMLVVVVPAGLFMGLDVNHTYQWGKISYLIDPKTYLVNFPVDFIGSLGSPDFGKIGTSEFWFFALAFFLAGNIESLLTCKAVDNMDPWHRQTDYNRDLLAIGIGNIVSGLFGGLPMISESKRSVVNVNLGGSTLASNFFHSLTLLIIVFVAQPLIRIIPVCALSAYLIFVGIRMTLPKEFSKSYSIGREQFLVFLVVFIVTLSVNFLTGIILGTILELIISLHFGATLKSLFKANFEVIRHSSHRYDVTIKGPAIFSNFLLAKKTIYSIPKGASVVFDFSGATLVDHSFLENIIHYEMTRMKSGGTIALTGLEYHQQVSKHPLASRRILKNEATPRQKVLMEFANANGIDFEGRRITNAKRHAPFLSDKWEVVYQENTLKYDIGNKTVEICDLFLESSYINKQQIHVTIFVVSNFSSEIPDLILQQEGFSGGLFDIHQKTDINFTDYPVFSYYYYLSSEDEALTRDYFNKGTILFFEQNKGYHLRTVEGTLLLYKRTELLAVEEIESSRNFLIHLIDLLK